MKRVLPLLALVALPACAPMVYPDARTIPPTEKLPIDGLWLWQSTSGSTPVRIDSGRMWNPHGTAQHGTAQPLIARDIRQIAPNKYEARVLSFTELDLFAGGAVTNTVPAELAAGPGPVVTVRTSKWSASLTKMTLDDEAWFSAQLAADRILTQAPAPRPAPVASISPAQLQARVRKLGGASWALVVGINAYRHADRLNYAVADARAVADALRGLGFQNVRLLLDDDATRANIEQAIYVDFKEKMSRDDRLFVFFAGHGITVELPRGGEEGYLIPVDGDPRRPEVTAIAMDEIRKMGRRVSARHIFFAIDSCFSGFAISRDIRPEAVSDQRIAAALDEPVVQVLTAGRKGQKAVEEEGHGIFTRRLLDGLRGLADREGRGFVTATELAAWLGPRVVRDSGGRQHPQYSALDGEGDFVFLLPKTER